MRRPLRPLMVWLLAGLVCFGCTADSLDRYLLDMPPPVEGQNPIRQKKYANPPLEWQKFNDLLEMAAYQGSPEQFGVVVMRERSESKGMPPVVFSHRSHRQQYTCRVCHLELEFSMRKGESGITRVDYLNGRFCGACHNGEQAFSVKQACNLCHISDQRQSASNSRTQDDPSVAGLARTGYGDRIDWMAAIRAGQIAPRNSLSGEKAQMMPLPAHLVQPLRWFTNVPGIHVAFPHQAHVAWLDCANCHPDLFEIKNMGTVAFDKEKNLYGLYCGACHMTVAFPMNGCGRCHPGHKDYDERPGASGGATRAATEKATLPTPEDSLSR